MEFEYSDKVKELARRLTAFRDEHLIPNEAAVEAEIATGDRWQPVALIESLKASAREQGLWNLFLPERADGHGLSNLEYAPLAEIMGCNEWAPEVFNCSAPDTGNMEVLLHYGAPVQRERWLEPLLRGEIRSCFAMTEPEVASSDATNMRASGRLDGDEWVLDGAKWYISGAGDPRCELIILMCLTEPEAPRHARHSMILVPMKTPGVTVTRTLGVMGYDHAPHGHAEIHFDGARVPAGNVLLGAGRGFEIAQGRLGPGRIHHCMRAIGAAERALELMCRRALSREAFGRPLAQLGGNGDIIADARIEIEMTRLLVLKTAYMMDTLGNKAAASEIAQIKVVAPNMACRVVDRAMQMHGAAGVSGDTPLAAMYANLRTLRLADGPDEVHRRTIARRELAKYAR